MCYKFLIRQLRLERVRLLAGHRQPRRLSRRAEELLDRRVATSLSPAGDLRDGIWIDATAGARSDARIAALSVVGAGASLGPDAEVGPYAVIGAGAAIGAKARVRRVVLWGASASGRARCGRTAW